MIKNLIHLFFFLTANGFTSSHIYASRSTLNLSHLDAHLNLHSKQISTTLKTDGINVPQTFGYIASDVPSTFVVQGTLESVVIFYKGQKDFKYDIHLFSGSVKFSTEPIIQNIRGVNLKQLSEDIWMANEDTVLSGSNMNLKNITLKADVMIHVRKRKNYREKRYCLRKINYFNYLTIIFLLQNPINSLNVKMWSDVSSKLLSKTKEQHITVVSSFKNVEVPAIVAANNATLESSDINLKDMLTNSLMRNAAQTVDAVWYFEELNISKIKLN